MIRENQKPQFDFWSGKAHTNIVATANRLNQENCEHKAMLRASSIHLSPFVCRFPPPIFALLPSLIIPSSPLPESHRRTAYSLPIYRRTSLVSTSNLSRFPGMSGQPCSISNATGPSTLILFLICKKTTYVWSALMLNPTKTLFPSDLVFIVFVHGQEIR